MFNKTILIRLAIKELSIGNREALKQFNLSSPGKKVKIEPDAKPVFDKHQLVARSSALL